MRLPILLLALGLLIFSCAPKEPIPFKDGLDSYPILKRVLDSTDIYQVQILFTRIDRNEHMNPMMETFSFNLDDERYFYPASTVKLPVAILALEWLEEQNVDNLNMDTPMLTDSVRPSQRPAYVDNSSQDSLPNIAHYIKKILLVSDNDAYNRLYELLGQDYINQKLAEKGLKQTVINHRLSYPANEIENRFFNPIRFVDKSGETILEIPERETKTIYSNSERPIIGKAYYSGDSLIEKGMEFTYKNKFALSDLHGVIQRIIFPHSFLENERFQLNEEHRNFILKYMSMLPGESNFPKYDGPDYYDSYSKFFKFGTDKSPIPDRFRIFNKTGWAYGHLIDGSYFVDYENGVEFFVSAIIYTNKNQTLNDDTYETEEIGLPFFAELGDYLYQIELKRKKMLKPDWGELKLDY
ncbi:class A beta-lactamase-related serine hydrolase [Algoriphagus limi]|uniref:beta-lactamase n=1 Tax=Algoriphagus limi TaxID=2975273 RepID=A0ABT2GAC2_9BACT|nr:class A beta-lactamase-related serine hydrolase [Algoriphagus limi]MCS5490945.1 class A beta-lactamase-related serine hydrolase [Algoriphagus limi]